jgi:hypothetical protein
VGKNKKPMLTVLVEEEKLQRFRDYAAGQGMSMGAVVNQLIDRLLSEESNLASIKLSIDNDKPIESNNRSIEIMINHAIEIYHKSMEGFVDFSINSNNKDIEEAIELSIEAHNKSIEDTIATSIEEQRKSIEETIATSIENYDKSSTDNYTETSNRLIGSTTSELKNLIEHQGAEIARLSKMVDELMASNIESLTTTAIQPPNDAVKGWVEFCKMIGEPLPSKQIKDNTGELIKLAKSKGFGDWRYDSNKKRFNQQGGAGR